MEICVSSHAATTIRPFDPVMVTVLEYWSISCTICGESHLHVFRGHYGHNPGQVHQDL